MLKYICGGLGMTSVGLGIQPYIEALQPYSLLFIFGGMVVFTLPWLLKVYHRIFPGLKNNSTKTSAKPDSNNPDLFPELNETALKKHIAKKISNTPYGDIISKITLYEPNVPGFKYQLIVEAPEYHKGFSNIKKNWDIESPLEDDFSDIYRGRTKDNYRAEWTCSVTDLNPQLQDILVVKSAKWVLYQKPHNKPFNHDLRKPPASQAG